MLHDTSHIAVAAALEVFFFISMAMVDGYVERPTLHFSLSQRVFLFSVVIFLW